VLEKAIPSRYVHEIDLLFNFPEGPSIRNHIAHGKFAAHGFRDPDCIYFMQHG